MMINIGTVSELAFVLDLSLYQSYIAPADESAGIGRLARPAVGKVADGWALR
jgi:hypothetical protein